MNYSLFIKGKTKRIFRLKKEKLLGITIAEKIFSKHSGRKVKAGETVIANVDLAMATDGSGPLAIDLYNKIGKGDVYDPEKVIMAIDHYVPCPNRKVSRLHDMMRDFAKAGKGKLFEIGSGIGHQLLTERGYIKPGMLIAGADSHSCTYGALNALGTGIGSSDLAAVIATGKLWFEVPETIRLNLEGALKENVTAKDLILYIIGKLKADGATYKSIEFNGKALSHIDIDDRLTICNMVVETGAKCGIMPFDQVTAHWFKEKGIDGIKGIIPDKDAEYCQDLTITLDTITPQIAYPHKVDNVVPVAAVEGTPIDMVFIGTCTNGRLKDLRIAAKALKSNKLNSNVELLIGPASREIYSQAVAEGLIEIFLQNGAIILPPGCGPCCGSSAGVPSDKENVFSTANRNFLGRMGNTKANIFLGSPITAISAAITGEIIDPGRMAYDSLSR